jgi:nucleoside diphosphate kinase
VLSSEGLAVEEVDWDRTVFALICPDALAMHLGLAVLERIESEGFTLVAWRVLWHRPADLDSFHEQNITQAWKAYRYRLVDQYFAFGPTVALLMADQCPAGDQQHSCHERLRLAKGPSDPAGSGPGTIRGDLGSINGMLGLMHCSDSAADSARESAVFAGPGGFAGGGDPGELRTMLALLELSVPRQDRGYREVLAGLRARAIAGAWEDLPRPVQKTAGAMLEAGAAELAAPGSGERLAALLPDAHPLAALLAADFTPSSPGPDPKRVNLLLATFGTGIDEWESLVLATSRRFTPRGLDHSSAS